MCIRCGVSLVSWASWVACIGLLFGCEPPSSPPPVISAWPVVHVTPTGDCDVDQQALQDALDMAPVRVSLGAGVFCLVAPLVVHSNTYIEGAGTEACSGADAVCETVDAGCDAGCVPSCTGGTTLEQHTSATGVFHLKSVEHVTIRDLRVLNAELSKAAPGDDCVMNPSGNGNCMWKRATAIAAYDTRDVRVSNTVLIGGRAGIVLLDQPNLEAPSGGPDAYIACNARLASKAAPVSACPLTIVDGEPVRWQIHDDTCSEGELVRNQRWIIEHNLVERARDGLLIYNLSDSIVRHNTLRNAEVFNGIKMGCGPIVRNHFVANYLFHNGFRHGSQCPGDGNDVPTLGDGLDVAWGWTDPKPQGEALSYDDRPDGPFRDNLFEGNLAWDNGGNGFAIKTKQGDQGCPKYPPDPPDPTDPTDLTDRPHSDPFRLGRNALLHNAAWHNGEGGGLLGTPPLGTTSQLELRCIYPLDPPSEGQQPQGMRVVGNVFAARLPHLPGIPPRQMPDVLPPSDPPRHGATLDRLWYARYADNWHDSDPTFVNMQRTAYDLYLRNMDSTHTSFFETYAEEEGVLAEGVALDQLDLRSPSTWALRALLWEVARTSSYHCQDDDGDGCPNICEALRNTDHLDGAGDESCTCWSLCLVGPPWLTY